MIKIFTATRVFYSCIKIKEARLRSFLYNLQVSAETPSGNTGRDVTSRTKAECLAFDLEKLEVDRQLRLAIPTADHSDT